MEIMIMTITSESKVEEIIATLWTIIWVLLWANNAHAALIWIVGIKAIMDHACSIGLAIIEHRNPKEKSHE